MPGSPTCRTFSYLPCLLAIWRFSRSWSTTGSARSHDMSARLLRGMGTWARWPGSALTAAHGTATSAPALLWEVTSRCCGTRMSTAAPGTATRATVTRAIALLREGTSRYCGTRMSTAAHGKATPALRLRLEGTSRCCGACTSTAARGTATPALRLLREGTSRCYGTRTSTAARCRLKSLHWLWFTGCRGDRLLSRGRSDRVGSC
ncbi:hypothetical protein T492DRAFT_155971 [Pavlovales sp. CCMP2436]|nr:hypothetical protein T492DRAFT_155971 [Pavlovales sp. CCMP2436]